MKLRRAVRLAGAVRLLLGLGPWSETSRATLWVRRSLVAVFYHWISPEHNCTVELLLFTQRCCIPTLFLAFILGLGGKKPAETAPYCRLGEASPLHATIQLFHWMKEMGLH